MGGRGLPILTSTFIAALVGVASAQERSGPAGAVNVRPVQVREVRVDQPASPHHHDGRPPRNNEQSSSGIERPVDPGFISRPVPRPQPPVQAPRRSNRNGRARRPSSPFNPRFNIGYGIVVGYPILYPYAYGDPFSPSSNAMYTPAAPARNTYSNVESLTTSPSVTALPATGGLACEGSAPCGGVSFDITPASAQVSVDGVFVGIVDDFNATSEPLLLAPGTHYLEVRLAGYRTATFDVTVTSGEVTPYQGTLERLRLRTP